MGEHRVTGSQNEVWLHLGTELVTQGLAHIDLGQHSETLDFESFLYTWNGLPFKDAGLSVLWRHNHHAKHVGMLSTMVLKRSHYGEGISKRLALAKLATFSQVCVTLRCHHVG